MSLHKDMLPGKHLHVNIMNESWNQDRIPAYTKLLAEHNISHNVNEIDYSVQTRSMPIMKGKLNLAIDGNDAIAKGVLDPHLPTSLNQRL